MPEVSSPSSKDELLLAKEREWEQIAVLARLLGINPSTAEINAGKYRTARLYGNLSLGIGDSGHYVTQDIQTIIQSNKPLFDSIHGIKRYEEEKAVRDAETRKESEAARAKERERMKGLRKALSEYLAKQGSKILVHQLTDADVDLMCAKFGVGQASK